MERALHRWPLAVGVALLLAAAASILAVSPSEARADADDCSGRSTPVCKSVKSCVSVNGGPFSCSEDFYYWPDAS